MKLSVSIRVAAQKLDYSQTKVAELTGISRQEINRLWRGKHVRAIQFSTLEKIAQALNCSPVDFFYTVEESQ